MIGRFLAGRQRGAAGAVLARAVSILASFLLTVAVARLLGVEAAGSYFLVFTSLAVVATFGRFGTDNLALKICGGDSKDIFAELGYGVALASLASLVGVGFVYLAMIVVDYRLPGFSPGLTLGLLSAVLAQAFAVIAGAVLRGRGHLAKGIVAELGSIPVLAMLLLLMLRSIGALDLTTALLSLAAASWLTALWAVPTALVSLAGEERSSNGPSIGGFCRYVRSRFRPLASMMGTSLLFLVLTWSPLYALSLMGSLASVSYFTTAARLANLVSLVPALQVAYLAPAFARLFHSGDLTSLNAMSARAVRQAGVLLLFPVSALTIGAVPVITLLYGAEFEPAAAPLAVLAVGSLVMALAGHVNPLMLLCNLESHALALNVLLVALWATGGLWTAGEFGAVGVAWFSATVNTSYAVVAAWLLQSRGIRSYLALSRPDF
ncbi:lipopolysaccharide biosynthesis protein [Cryobacterium cryoconiti]|uniref:Polysaccharide biosynthesis protein C-terminal domain-containing protein n=1 Tax=Cryobacterium cryoconiti TaxID=1259239 RepID=A0A4Y8JTA3_9MICO|nr:hypothetical protein [Cryobacterium cryoconiti]TFD28001.1 hypothetical protein E3T49_12340 [Cryobacterium cryoconiti]